MKQLPYSQQTIDKSDVQSVVKVLKSKFLTQGPAVAKFEQSLAKYVQSKYCLVFNSGTAALHAAYAALGIGKGDEVITSPMTFAATANAALYLGAKPVFVDIEPDSGLIDPALIEAAISKRTKAIAPIDYAGQPADLNTIKKIAHRHKLYTVEDACHALGGRYGGRMIGSGSRSDITVFSFHPVKHITTGEGGAIVTNSRQVYQKAAQFRSHGITKDERFFRYSSAGAWYHEMQLLGYNYRLSDIQAALGSSQLAKLPIFISKRQALARAYYEQLGGSEYYELPPVVKHTSHAYHLFPIRLKQPYIKYKKQLFELLHKRGLGVQVHYLPVYLHPYYRDLGYKKGLCPMAEKFYHQEISIPIFPNMTQTDVKRVCRTLHGSLKSLIR